MYKLPIEKSKGPWRKGKQKGATYDKFGVATHGKTEYEKPYGKKKTKDESKIMFHDRGISAAEAGKLSAKQRLEQEYKKDTKTKGNPYYKEPFNKD